MSFSKVTRAHFLFKSNKELNRSVLVQMFSYTRSHGVFSTPICSKTQNLKPMTSLPAADSKVADELISIFTTRPFCPDSQELGDFGLKLSNGVVEAVLKSIKSWRIAHIFFNWVSNQQGYKHNCYTYNAMAAVLSHARQNAPLRVLATDLVTSRCWMTPGALGFFLRCLSNQGMVEEANLLFDQVKKVGICIPNVYSYNCLLEAISKSSSVDLLELRLEEMNALGLEFDKFTLTPVLQCYCNAREFEKALDVFNQMHDRGWVDGYIFSILVLAFSKGGEVDKAFELIAKMEDLAISMNEKTFYVLIHGFVREFRVDKALQLFDRMRNVGFSPDISIYGVLIEGLCENKEFKRALCLYSQMSKMGIPPDAKILTSLISSLPEEIERIKLLEEGKQILDDQAMLLLNNSVLKGLVDNGSTDKAYNLLHAMMGDISYGNNLVKAEELVHLNTSSFEIVIGGLILTGKLDVALCLFQIMAHIGCKPSVLLYNNLINGLSIANRLEECFKLLGEMKESGLKPTHFTHNVIFGCQCSREDVTGAIHMLREMRVCGHEPWIKCSTMLVKKLCENGRAVEARNFLADMVQEGFLPDIIAYSAAIDGFVIIKEVDQALKLFREICERGYFLDVVAYNIIINGLCKAKRVSEAQEILSEMLAKGLVPSVFTYNLLIDGCCKTGDIDNAIRLLSRIIQEKQDPNIITYTTIIDGLCNFGRPNDALELWREMEEKGCLPNKIAFMAFIQGLCKCGRPCDASVFFQEMEEKKMLPDSYVYVALIDAFISKSNPIMAFDILKKLIHSGNIPSPVDKNLLVLKEAILKLSKDTRTSSNVRSLLGDTSIVSLHRTLEIGCEDGLGAIPRSKEPVFKLQS